jgi:single-strand DNA-binding protein
VEKFVRKGTQVYVEGKIRSRSYDDQNGIRRYITEIYADTLEILSRRNPQTESVNNTTTNASHSGQNADLEENSEVDDLPF